MRWIGVNGFDIPQDVQDNIATLRNDGAVNAIDPDFEIPSQYRWNFGINHTLPWDIELKADVIYSRVKEEVLWQDIRLQQIGTAPDGRPIYGPRDIARSSSVQDFLLTNTSEGEQTVFTVEASKTWHTGAGRFDGYLGYGHQDVKDVNPGTSSTASSNWDNVAVSDPNDPGLETSNYEIEHRFTGSFAWRKAFFGDYETSLALVGERRSGRPYSYTFGAGTLIWGDPRQASRQRHLFYVPDGDVIFEGACTAADVGVVAGCTATGAFSASSAAAGQFAADMDQFIQQQGLEHYRGRIVPRNSHTQPLGVGARPALRAGAADLPQDARHRDLRHRELREPDQQGLGPAAPGQLPVRGAGGRTWSASRPRAARTTPRAATSIARARARPARRGRSRRSRRCRRSGGCSSASASSSDDSTGTAGGAVRRGRADGPARALRREPGNRRVEPLPAARARRTGDAVAAAREFDGLVARLADAGVEVVVADDSPEPAKPDACFPNNWVSFHADGSVVLYPMMAPSRRAERRAEPDRADVRACGFSRHAHHRPVARSRQRGEFLEGTGSLVLDRCHRIAYACRSPRTTPAALAEFLRGARLSHRRIRCARPGRAPAYHTNVLMAIGEGFAVVCAEAIRG